MYVTRIIPNAQKKLLILTRHESGVKNLAATYRKWVGRTKKRATALKEMKLHEKPHAGANPLYNLAMAMRSDLPTHSPTGATSEESAIECMKWPCMIGIGE